MSKAQQSIPRHVAVVMDGNGRWAKARLMPRLVGHNRGVETVRSTIRACRKAGVKYLTLFAFSSENWKRPMDEVEGLMSLFMIMLDRERSSLIKNDIRLQLLGDRSRFSVALQEKIASVEAQTHHCTGMHLLIAANYGGRWDITQAAKRLCEQVLQGHLDPSQLTEQQFATYLSTAEMPDPDLFIRTGGEKRISNFLLWQLAYCEFYFTDKLWPEFDEPCMQEALAFYAQRQRRFGMIEEQLQQLASHPYA